MESRQQPRQQELLRKSGRAFFLMIVSSAIVSAGIRSKAQDRAQESIGSTDPTSTSTLCRFALALPEMEGTLTLGIFAPEGNLVRLLYHDSAIDSIPAGLNGLLISWDGKDDSVVDVPPGIYHARGLVHGKIAASLLPMSDANWHSSRLQEDKGLPFPLMQNPFPENRITIMAAHDALLEKRPLLSISAHWQGENVALEAEGMPILALPMEVAQEVVKPAIELHHGGRVGTAELTLFFPEGKESYLIIGLDKLVPLDAGALPMPPQKH